MSIMAYKSSNQLCNNRELKTEHGLPGTPFWIPFIKPKITRYMRVKHGIKGSHHLLWPKAAHP